VVLRDARTNVHDPRRAKDDSTPDRWIPAQQAAGGRDGAVQRNNTRKRAHVAAGTWYKPAAAGQEKCASGNDARYAIKQCLRGASARAAQQNAQDTRDARYGATPRTA